MTKASLLSVPTDPTLPDVTAASVKMRFPEFRSLPDTDIEYAIDDAMLSVDATFGRFYVVALTYLSAHYLLRSIQMAQTGTGQSLQSVSVGGEISWSYARSDTRGEGGAQYSDLMETPYGQRFLELTAIVQPAVAII